MLVYPALVPMHSYTDAESGLRTEIDSRKASDHSDIKCPLQKSRADQLTFSVSTRVTVGSTLVTSLVCGWQ